MSLKERNILAEQEAEDLRRRVGALTEELAVSRHASVILKGDKEAVATYRLLRSQADDLRSRLAQAEARLEALKPLCEAAVAYADVWLSDPGVECIKLLKAARAWAEGEGK